MKKIIINSQPDLIKAGNRDNGIVKTVRFELNNINTETGKKAKIMTFGCQSNIADGEIIKGLLEELGYLIIEDESIADLVLLNTCAIREGAEEKIWGIVGRLKKLKLENPDLIIGLCGCMAQEEKTIMSIRSKYPQIDLVFGTHNIHELPVMLENVKNGKKLIQVYSHAGLLVENLPKSRESKHKAYVNIMYGCDEFCAYCIVPYTRGKKRSRNKEDIINEVKDLHLKGYLEVTLLGQNVNAYGTDFENIDYSFGDLLNDLTKTGIRRLRFTTNHPHYIDNKTIEAMAKNDVIMPHIHLPVQSGSNKILALMNRKYTKEEYLQKIKMLKERIPDIAITTDIIVGFCQETLEDFQETLALVKEADFEGAFTFIYSKRSGTKAEHFSDTLTVSEKKLRLKTLNAAINEGYLKGHKKYVGKVVEVLVDNVSKNNPDMLTGYSRHNKVVNFKGKADLIGKFVEVKITKANTWFMTGEAL